MTKERIESFRRIGRLNTKAVMLGALKECLDEIEKLQSQVIDERAWSDMHLRKSQELLERLAKYERTR